MTIRMHGKAVKYLSAISLNERIKYIRLLFRWQGSVWSLLWADFLWFLFMYIGVTLLYRLYLIHDVDHKRRFETLVSYMNKVGALVPLSFLLGFFVSTILGRWWDVITSIPWMTKPTFACQALITGGNRKTCQNVRTTFVRYMNLAWILALMQLSQKVKQRFFIEHSDSHKSMIRKKKKLMNFSVRERLEKINADESVKRCFGKIITEEEIKVFENFEKGSTDMYKPPYIIPLMWTTKLLEKSLKEGFILSERMYMSLYKIVLEFRGGLGTLSMFNEFNVPLVYTQVVIIVVYTFLFSEIFSQQMIMLDPVPLQPSYLQNNTRLYMNFNSLNWKEYFPVFTIFKFLIYMGWFKIGLSLINPLGREKTDIPLDVILDYNLEISSTVAPAEDFYFPDYLSSKCNLSDRERLEYLNQFQHTPSSMLKLYDTVDGETSLMTTGDDGKLPTGDDKEPLTFVIA